MSDVLFDFGDEGVRDENPSISAQSPADKLMSQSQRAAIRDAFAALDISDAEGQFAVVEELTGKRPSSVAGLSFAHAQTLIIGLQNKVANARRIYTGNAWDDRVEETWIDKL